MIMTPENVTWESANLFIERQTVQIEETWHSSRPMPRARAMGLKGEPKRRDYSRLTEEQRDALFALRGRW